jgi:hypothetical protein
MDMATLTAALATLAIFSFLYRDNPLYRAAEHILIGLSVGFTIVLLWSSVLEPKILAPLFGRGDLWTILPLALSLLMLLRLKSSWVSWSKPVIALVIGAGAGLSIPAMVDARILKQMSATVAPFAAASVGWWGLAEAFIGLAGCVSVLVYFFYTRGDKGFVGWTSHVGIYFLMVFFGATFGYTVTSRITLLIGRVEFLLGSVLGLL